MRRASSRRGDGSEGQRIVEVGLEEVVLALAVRRLLDLQLAEPLLHGRAIVRFDLLDEVLEEGMDEPRLLGRPGVGQGQCGLVGCTVPSLCSGGEYTE